MMIIFSACLVLIAILFFMTYHKIEFMKIRSTSKKISAVVIEYKKEKGPMRNDYTPLNYPYVKLDSDNNNLIVKLRYANNLFEPFDIDEKIAVFWHEDDLLYWDAYNRGLNKYLPEKWNFIKF